jgi:hypothetical protein
MKLDQLTEVFTKQVGARKEGTAYLVPHEAEASIFVTLEGDTLTIAKVTRLEVEGTLVLIDTAKHERYVVAAEDVRAVKIDRGEAPRRDRSAGFGK